MRLRKARSVCAGLLLLVTTCITAFSQNKARNDVDAIRTREQAQAYLDTAVHVNGDIMTLVSDRDTSELAIALLDSPVGEVIDFPSEDGGKHFFFKVLDAEEMESFRVQYIYLDNRKLSLNQIDSLRKVIFLRLAGNEPFDKLAAIYSMDGNAKKGGDLGWFSEGTMKTEFEDKVRAAHTGQIFTVDIPLEKWYYVVRKSHNPRIGKRVSVLYVEASIP